MKELNKDLAMKRIRQAIEYGKYMAWCNDVGKQKAFEIVDDFHNGVYGSKTGFWVQVEEAFVFMEGKQQ